ncbi:MAG: hypothetical protein KC493_05700, partial [Bacteriovoracaceae bacterium]|nr:hypothetical protein [Bacteriovoracaceae bacterium]
MRIKSGFLTIFLTFLLSACGAGAPSDPLGVSPAGGGDSSTQPTTPMSVSIEQFFNQPDPTTIAPVKFKITFSRSIDPGSFFIGDITQSGTATGVTWTMTGPHGNFYNLFASATGSGTIIPTIAEDSVMDTFGNRNLASTSSDNSVTYNYNPLSVSIDQKVGQDDPTCTLPIEFDIVFAQAIDPATFDTSDINQNGTASGITWNLINSGDDTNFTLQATAVTTPGTIIPSLGANAAQTTSLVPNIPSSSTDNNIVFTTDLTVNIEQALAQADPALGLPISYDVKFCRAINSGTFTTADINQDGSASGITWNIVNSGDDISFTLEATAVTTGGTLQPSISANAVQDPGAANNIISNSSDNSVLYDNKVEVTLEQKIGQSDPTSSLPVEFTVTFENAIDPATFSALDIQQNGTATGITWNIINSGDDTVFTLQATAISGQGSVIPSIPANGVADPSSTPNGNSTSIDNEVKYHTTFDATVEQKVGQDDPTASLPLEFTVTFSEAIDAST